MKRYVSLILILPCAALCAATGLVRAERPILEAYRHLPVDAAHASADAAELAISPTAAAIPEPILTPLQAAGESLPAPPDGTVAERPMVETDAIVPETLEDAWQVALAANPVLHARRYKADSAEFAVRVARADRRPQWTVDTGYVVRDQEPSFVITSPLLPTSPFAFPNAQREAFQLLTEVSVPLFTGGRIRHDVSAATLKRNVAEQEVAMARTELKLQVAFAYLGVLRALRDQTVAQQHLTAASSHLNDATSRLSGKQARQFDQLSAQIAVQQAQQKIHEANNRLDLSVAEYNRLLQRPLASPVRLAEIDPPTIHGNLETLTHEALARRPELIRLALKSQSLAEEAAAAKAARRPQFDLRGQYAFEENRFRDPEGIAAVSVGMHWNALDGGRSRNRAKSLQQESISLAKLRDDMESTIRLEVRRAWLDADEAHRRVNLALQNLSRAEERLRLARENHAAGMSDNSAVLDTVVLRDSLQRDYHHAVYDAVMSLLRLRRAAGEL